MLSFVMGLLSGAAALQILVWRRAHRGINRAADLADSTLDDARALREEGDLQAVGRCIAYAEGVRRGALLALGREP